MIPAFHRAPVSRTAVVELTEGEHSLEIVVNINGDPKAVYVLPVATAETKSPGPCYYLTDIIMHANETLLWN